MGGIDIHCIHAKWNGVGGQALVHSGRGLGARGIAPPPPLENEKKMLSEEILASFIYVLIMKLGGIDTLYMQNGKWWADRRPVSMVGRRGDLSPP